MSKLKEIHLLQGDDKDQPIDILRKEMKFIKKRRKEAFKHLKEIHLLRNHF